MPICAPKSTRSFHAGLRASGKSSTSMMRPTRMSTAAKWSKSISLTLSEPDDLHPPRERGHRERAGVVHRHAERRGLVVAHALHPLRLEHAVGGRPDLDQRALDRLFVHRVLL